MITTHRLPESLFCSLAAGHGGPAAIRYLREAQQSKHVMLLHAVAEAAGGAGAADPEAAVFGAGYRLLARVQAADPGACSWLLSLPHLGGWVHDCLIRLENGSRPDLAHAACLAAAAAIRAGVPFELDVPVRDGRVLLPGLGSLAVAGPSPAIRLACDGERVTAGREPEVARRLLVPGDGRAGPDPRWRGTPGVRAVADGLAWDVQLEADDRYLDRYTLPMSAGLPAGDADRWRGLVQAAWEVLVRHHRAAAGSIAAGVAVIVPLTAQRDTDLVSATSPAAFGAIATSWPPDAVTMAETLVHEFHHVKLGGLIDMVPLVEPGEHRVYAPWRQDPRPAGGLLQGLYAHLAIARFWNAQQHAETDPDGVLRAQAQFARWRPAIDQAARTLLAAGCLTPDGVRFTEILRDQARSLEAVPVPGDAQAIAGEVALDHWLTWQLRHVRFEPAEVAHLASAYRRGEGRPARSLPRGRIEADTRKVESTVRSRLLSMRYLAPARYRELCAGGVLPLSEADALLVNGNADAAIDAYRDQIAGSVVPQPDAWIGLALALHQLPGPPPRAFTTDLALMFEVHACLDGRRDPLDLAGWFT